MNKSIKILLIEDDDVDIQHFGRVLMKSGLNTDLKAVKDAQEGLDELKQKDYDILFLDYKLPGSDGLKLLKQIRDAEVVIPVIVVTSQGDEQVAVNMMKAGATDYIPKSLMTVDGLTQSIRNAMRYNELSQRSEKAQNDLAAAESRLQTIVSSFDIIIFSVDKKGDLTLCEGKSLKSLGLKADELIGKSIFDLFNGHREIKLLIKEVLRGKDVRKTIEFKKIVLEFDCKPVKSKDGTVEGSLGIAKDITERVKSEQALMKAKQVAENSARVKEVFLANMSHEIRTPMNAIIGFTDLLLQKELNKEQGEYIASIKQAGENLMVIINDVLDFSKIEAGKLTIERAPFNLHETVSSLQKVLEQKAKDKKLNLLFNIDKAVPRTMVGDSIRCYQILMNLVDNAIKFTEKGSVEVSVKVKERKEGKTYLLFKVKDTGIGIPAEMLETIFESFTQATDYTTRKYGGTGLGLTIVKRLVDLQNGSIHIESKENKGSMFMVELPFTEVEHKLTVQSDSTGPVDEDGILEGKRVLIVEDNVMNQLVAKKHLERWKMKVDIASNGIVAVDKAINNDYHLILMDVQMPLMNGYEATKRIRSKGSRFRYLPIFAMTAHAFDREREKCLDAGMNDYISKPFKPDSLKRKIISMLKADALKTEFSMSGTGSRNLCDLTMLKELADGDVQFMSEAIEMYIELAAKSVTEMDKSFKTDNRTSLKSQAHNLKSTVMMMGIQELNGILEKLDNDEDDELTNEEVKVMLDRLTTLVRQSTMELKERLNILQFNYQMRKAG